MPINLDELRAKLKSMNGDELTEILITVLEELDIPYTSGSGPGIAMGSNSDTVL